MNITETYTGTDATLEILLMLVVSFLLGALLMWLYNTYLFECIDDDSDEEDMTMKIVEPVQTEKEVKVSKKEIVEKVVVSQIKEDDLKIIEGVGPKIESILKSAGMNTLEDVSHATADQIREILREKGGERYAFHDPATWPDQARLAHDGREEELKEYQAFLSGGKMS